nr:auxilin-like protein [Tanacetum cinerariifolium]
MLGIASVAPLSVRGYKFKHDYTIIESPRTVVFLVNNNERKIMRFNEIYKFIDGTLTRILEALAYRVMEFKIKRLNSGTPSSTCQTISNIDAHVEEEQFHESKQSSVGRCTRRASPRAYKIDVVIAKVIPCASAVGGAGGDASGASVGVLVTTSGTWSEKLPETPSMIKSAYTWKVFTRDIYEDHVVSCPGIVGIKHRHNVVRDTLVDICYRFGISSSKEVDIGLGEGRDKSLRSADMLLYSWDGRLDVCMDLTGTSPLTQTRMADFMRSRAMLEAAQRKRVKYEAKCADIGYGFLPFSFSSFGELEKDVVKLLKRIRNASSYNLHK